MEAIRGQKSLGSCSYGCCELPDVDVKLWSSKISESSLCAQSSPRPIQHLPVRILLLFICFNLLSSLSHIIVPPLLLINVNHLLALPGCRGTDRILFLLLLSRFSWFQHLAFCYICWGEGGQGRLLCLYYLKFAILYVCINQGFQTSFLWMSESPCFLPRLLLKLWLWDIGVLSNGPHFSQVLFIHSSHSCPTHLDFSVCTTSLWDLTFFLLVNSVPLSRTFC